MCVALGTPVLGSYPVQQGVVLHLDFELGPHDMEIRYRQLMHGAGRSLSDGGAIWWRSFPPVRLDDPEAREVFTRLAQAASLIVIDPYRPAINGSENDSGTAKVLGMLGEISSETGCTFVVVHHTGKGGSARGSTAILDRAGCAWSVEETTAGTFSIRQTKRVPIPCEPLRYRIEDIGGTDPRTSRAQGLRLVETEPVVQLQKPDEVVARILDALAETGAAGLLASDLKLLVGGDPRTYHAKLNQLLAEGRVERSRDPSDGRRHTYRLGFNGPGLPLVP
jgi:hypothetical protein